MNPPNERLLTQTVALQELLADSSMPIDFKLTAIDEMQKKWNSIVEEALQELDEDFVYIDYKVDAVPRAVYGMIALPNTLDTNGIKEAIYQHANVPLTAKFSYTCKFITREEFMSNDNPNKKLAPLFFIWKYDQVPTAADKELYAICIDKEDAHAMRAAMEYKDNPFTYRVEEKSFGGYKYVYL